MTSPLGPGQHRFAVRVLDAAGSCGPAATFPVWVPIVMDGFESGDKDRRSSAAAGLPLR